jgi:hypothetical protein
VTAKGLAQKRGFLFPLPREGVPDTRATHSWGVLGPGLAIPTYGRMGQVLKDKNL